MCDGTTSGPAVLLAAKGTCALGQPSHRAVGVGMDGVPARSCNRWQKMVTPSGLEPEITP
jgi:hypothetical protein